MGILLTGTPNKDIMERWHFFENRATIVNLEPSVSEISVTNVLCTRKNVRMRAYRQVWCQQNKLPPLLFVSKGEGETVGGTFSARVPRSSAEVRRVFVHHIVEVEVVWQ